MKRVTKSVLMMLAAVLLTVGFSTTAVAKEKKILLKVPVALPTSLPILGEGIVYFKKTLEAMDNTIKVKIYEPGKLMPAFEIHDAVSTGKVNAGYSIAGYIQGKVPAASLFAALPFGPRPDVFAAWFREGNGGKLYQEMYEKNGYNIKVIPMAPYAAETAGWYRKEINSADDLKGLKIRFFGLGGKVMSKLGASVALLPGAEIFPALEKGALDATEFSLPVVDKKLGFYKIAKYNYFPGWHQPSSQFELLINKDVWNSMSKRQQAVVTAAAEATNFNSIARSISIQGKYLKENEAKGVKNLRYNKELLDLFKKTWDEVAAEEGAKDPFFKKVLEDQTQFFKEVKVYTDLAY